LHIILTRDVARPGAATGAVSVEPAKVVAGDQDSPCRTHQSVAYGRHKRLRTNPVAAAHGVGSSCGCCSNQDRPAGMRRGRLRLCISFGRSATSA
jgi:hypothetical protein